MIDIMDPETTVRPVDSEPDITDDMLARLRAVSGEGAHQLVAVTLRVLNSAKPVSATTTPILVLADRRMVLIFDLFRPLLTPAQKSISAISSRYAVLSTLAWKRKHSRAKFMLLDDSKVHKNHGTLDRIQNKLADAFGDEAHEVSKDWCIDFSPYENDSDALDEICPRLSRQVSESLASYDIPRATEHLRTEVLTVPSGAVHRLLTDDGIAAIDVTNLGLSNTSAWAYTLVPRGELRKQCQAALGDSWRFVSSLNLRLFVRLDGRQAHIRLSPHVMAYLPASYLARFLKHLEMPSEHLELTPHQLDEFTPYSAGAEIHQLASFMLSRRFFPILAQWAAKVLGIEVHEDREFSRLLLGTELDDLVRDRADDFLGSWDANPGPDHLGSDSLLSFDEALRSSVIGWDLATRTVKIIKDNWEDDHQVTTVRDLIPTLNDTRMDTEEKVSWLLHCLADGGYVSTVATYDPNLAAWLPAWRTGESSNCPIGTLEGTGFAVNPQTKLSTSVMSR